MFKASVIKIGFGKKLGVSKIKIGIATYFN